MPALPGALRSMLESAISNKDNGARGAAEAGARAALSALAVTRAEPFPTMSAEERRLRNLLRAQARQLGGGDMHGGIEPLVEEIAYAQWHRMLFARFLAENGLLMHPSGAPTTIEECNELAPEEGAEDGWDLAARYAARMLPGIFRDNDPTVKVRFAPEARHRLEAILASLPPAVFTSDDALGWVYQFWQTKKKAEVNASGKKIGAEELAPVTQLFTEHYMVQFLLENSLGAWWAARHPESPLLKEYTYLRYRDDGTPAAGTFPGWPQRAAEVTVMDPCCGSGHFLVAAFEMLRRMRMEEEGLDETSAADAVLRDNLFGLELDPRCTQIAAFALALAAWKAGGYRELPLPNLACSGIGVGGRVEEWTRLAGDDVRLKTTLERLYYLFRDAPTLGSLINPADVPMNARLFSADYAEVEPLLRRALAKERAQSDPTAEVFGAAAEGIARAARLLAGTYTLVATNVPYLTRSKQDDVLMRFCELHYPDARRDLATCFVERCLAFAESDGSCAIVCPQNWLFLRSYEAMRKRLLADRSWNHVARLGAGAFETIGGEVVKVALLILTNRLPAQDQMITGLDVSASTIANYKSAQLCETPLQAAKQQDQLCNPDARLNLDTLQRTALLGQYATSLQGISTADYPRFGRCFWEFPNLYDGWRFQQSAVTGVIPYGGREHIVWMSALEKDANRIGAAIRGRPAWGKRAVAVSQMGSLSATLSTGECFDTTVAVLLPKNQADLPAIWAYCSSVEFSLTVRQVNQKLSVDNGYLSTVAFDLERWQKIAEEAGPLPEPYSNDPTQWLFEGHPVGSTEPLQVTVARLLGYGWPRQKPDDLDNLADTDGILPLPAVAGEQTGAERLRAFLAAAYGSEWSPAQAERLLAAVGYAGKGLEVWLRDGFFEQHCRLFHNRPFIWHVWDGRRDGFSALVNYHLLDRAHLDRLIYTYLGAWIGVQQAARNAEEPGAEARLVAALKLQKALEAIRDGEPPYDIYVRWKPLHKQPMGWEPDLNDGVRLNIRPFVTAGVLRSKFTVHWNKDRGTNPDGSARLNDLHYTLAEKHAARVAAGG